VTVTDTMESADKVLEVYALLQGIEGVTHVL